MRLPPLDMVNYELRENPFRHVTYLSGSLLNKSNCMRLVNNFPSSSLLDSYSSGTDKTYYTRVLSLHDKNGWNSQVRNLLSPDWQLLASSLMSSEQLDSICKILGLGKKNEWWFELRLAEYIAGGWMSRHTDRADKIFTLVLYLCPEWLSHWGGGLALYESEHAEFPRKIITPGAGNAVIFVRSESSWHEVIPISVQALATRRTLLLHAYNNL